MTAYGTDFSLMNDMNGLRTLQGMYATLAIVAD